MLVFCREQWDKNKKLLEEELCCRDLSQLDSYEDVFGLIIEVILNNNDKELKWDVSKLTRVDDGDYQGTILFVIPEDCYQPDEASYLMGYVGYGSCSGCDALQAITPSPWGEEEYDVNKTVSEFMRLAAQMLSGIVRPYNLGWRKSELFDEYKEPIENNKRENELWNEF